jgi:hypothetical protein
MSRSYFPPELQEAEDRLVRQRAARQSDPDGPRIGLALSGGGIRSATFCLGFMQSLARQRVLHRFDYLSTVSGGGYAGSFLGKWINQVGIDTVERELADSKSKPVSFLRENGRYLAPNGTGDEVSAAAAYVRNWLTCTLVMGTLGLGFFLCIELLRSWLYNDAAFAPSVGGAFVWSPFLKWALYALLLVDLPLVFGFWFPSKSVARVGALWGLTVVGAIFALWLALARGSDWDDLGDGEKAFAGLAGATLLAALLGQATVWMFPAKSANWVRLKMTQFLAFALVITGVIILFAAIDSLVLTLANTKFQALLWSGGLVSLPGLLGVGYKVLPWISEFTKKKTGGPVLTLLLVLASVVVLLAVLVTLGFVAREAVTWLPTVAPWMALAPISGRAVAAGVVLACAAVFGWGGFWFVNYASFHRLYSSRLTRSYLGASNPERQKETKNWNMSDLLPNDDIAYKDYRPHAKGGPIHLINATVNETISGRSNTVKRDRKGFGLCLGPIGIVAGQSEYVVFDETPSKPPSRGYVCVKQRAPAGAPVAGAAVEAVSDVEIEMMSLGNWVGISGAALSTGMGAKTSISTSFLLGYFNLRLGYWWDSGWQPWIAGGQREFKVRRSHVRDFFALFFAAQEALGSEYLASFRGPESQRWYLTDGGHFENTGVYELIRRKVKLIICCDCGCDPDYAFDDVGNLVRLARIDFGAEISFLTRANQSLLPGQIRRIGGLVDETIPIEAKLKPDLAARQIAVATIVYDDGSTGVLVIVKPSVFGGGPLDVRNYAIGKSDFPQQSTLEQFFDEAQWESYRKLGESLGERLIGPDGATANETLDALLRVAG